MGGGAAEGGEEGGAEGHCCFDGNEASDASVVKGRLVWYKMEWSLVQIGRLGHDR